MYNHSRRWRLYFCLRAAYVYGIREINLWDGSMNKMKRNEKKWKEKKERGEGKERKYRGKIPTFFRRVVERRRGEEEKRIERNAVRSVIRTCSIRRKKEYRDWWNRRRLVYPLPLFSSIMNWQKCIESRRFFFFFSFFLLSLYLIRESRSENVDIARK